MTDFFEMPERWVLPGFIWKQSLEDMALDGAKGCEGVALWLGRHHEGAGHTCRSDHQLPDLAANRHESGSPLNSG